MLLSPIARPVQRRALLAASRNLFIAATILLAPAALTAQLAGKGAITGSVQDSTGAKVPGAVVTVTNGATGIATVQTTSSAGDYSLSTLDPGIYTVVVKAAGFETITQQDVHVNALEAFTYSPKLTIGSEAQNITVSSAPPALETSNATLGATMENDLYSALPIEMGAYGQPDQRRATDFAFLMPGVQGNNTNGNATTNTGIVNGSGSRGAVSAVYIDGLPFVRAGGNGDPRFVWTAISVDAVDQFQVQTSGYSAIYEGQGIQNYTVKAGGQKYHGSVYEFFRNTVLDTYGFLGSMVNPAVGHAVKPVEHSNEYGINLSGPLLPFGRLKDKLFVFGNYNGFRYASETPTANTFPTASQQIGNFQGVVAGGIFDPGTQTACTANNAGKPCRYRYGYVFGGTPTNGISTTNPGGGVVGPLGAAGVDVIPASQFSAVALKMQSYLPAGIGPGLQNNYISQNRTGLSNFSTTERIDYVLGPNDSFTLIAAVGRQASSNPVGQATVGRNVGPLPYNYSQAFAPKTAVGIVEETHTFTPHLVNQFKYGYARYNGPTFDSDQVPQYSAATQGISIPGAPAGAVLGAFPITTFSGTNAPTNWAGTTPNLTLAENYSLVDTVQWVKGKHTITVGGQIAWLLYNVNNATGSTTPLTLANSPNETAALSNAFTVTPNTGLSYASFLIGQIDSTSFTQYVQQEFGTRFRAISPYVQDNWKATSKLTFDLGLRYDFFPTLTEIHNAGSFFDPKLANPVTGQLGALNFTGSGAGTCNCSTPVNNYHKNIGPRLGLAFQVDPKTVLRASYGIMFTHGGAVGGSAFTLGTLGFSAAPKFGANGSLLSTAPFTGSNGALPAFAPACGVASGPQFGTGYVLAAPLGVSSCGNASTSATAFSSTPSNIGYPDPYLGSRAPEYINYTLGFQHQWGDNFTSTMTYVGSQGHFLPADGSNARGFYADQLDPKYLYLGTHLADVGAAELADCANFNLPCPANFNTTQSLAGALRPFPFQGVTDAFPYVVNSNYHSLQVSLNMRATHGLTFMANYTWSKAIDDGGTFRTGYTIPAAFSPTGQTIQQDRIERSLSTSDQPQHLVVTGVYALPLGKTVLNNYAFERAIFGGFKFSEIFQAFSGSPLAITSSACATNQAQSTCNPTLNPNFSGQAHVNGRWGAGAVASSPTPISYIAISGGTASNPTGPFINPSLVSTSPFTPSFSFGNAARTAPLDLFGPGNYQLDLALVRSFPLHFSESARFNFRAEMYNVTNKTFFAVASTQLGNSTFGTVTTNTAYNRRAAQFSARVEF